MGERHEDWQGHLEELLVLEGVVRLPVRHGARLEPAVEHVIHPPQGAPPPPAGDRQVVDEVPVQVVHLVLQRQLRSDIAFRYLTTHADRV